MNKEKSLILLLYIIIGGLVMLLVILVDAEPVENLNYLEKDPLLEYAYTNEFTHIVYINKDGSFCPFIDPEGNFIKYENGHYERVCD